MGRERKALDFKDEGHSFVVRFRHPVSDRIVRFNLGGDRDQARNKLGHLNGVFLNETLWRNLPADFPPDLRDLWEEACGGVKVSRHGVRLDGKVVPSNAKQVAKLHSVIKALEVEVADYRHRYMSLKKKYERERGGKLREGPCPTLQKAAETWKANYTGRKGQWAKIVGYDVDRFVDRFGADTLVDDVEGSEVEIDAWLKGLMIGEGDKARPIGAGRRAQIRRHVLRFLEDSGALMQRKKVATVKRKEIRRDRGAIRWLEADQAARLAENLPEPWRSVFKIQCAIGLRPSEVATLKRSDISGQLHTLTLSPIPDAGLTLKTGSRAIGLHRYPAAQSVLKTLLEAPGEVLFTDPTGKAPWQQKTFYKAYSAALKPAAVAAGIAVKVDARIGRRTCASIQLREGKSVEAVAALLGDDPATIREHYAAILSHEV